MLYSSFNLRPRNFRGTPFGNSTSPLLLHSPHAPFTPLPTSPRRALARSQILRATSANSPLPPVHYKAISQHLSQAFAAGEYLKDGPPKGDAQQSAPPNPLTDPAAMDGMMGQMKTQMVMMVPQMVIMGWINFFFQGFVLSECCVRFVVSCCAQRDPRFPFPQPSSPATSPCAARARPHTASALEILVGSLAD